jgi:hypothetical protein
MTLPKDDAKPVDLIVILARYADTTPGHYETKSGWNNGGCPSRFLHIKGLGAYELPAAEAVFFAASHADVPAMAADLAQVRAGLTEALDELESTYRHERSRASVSAMAQVTRLRALLPAT